MFLENKHTIFPWIGLFGPVAISMVFTLTSLGDSPSKAEKDIEKQRTELLNNTNIQTALHTNRGGGLGMSPTMDIRANARTKIAVYSWGLLFFVYVLTAMRLNDIDSQSPQFDTFKFLPMFLIGFVIFVAACIRYARSAKNAKKRSNNNR